MALALDELKTTDITQKVNEFDFVVDKELFDLTGNLTLDFVTYGFNIKSEHELAGAKKDCGSCSCGS